MAWNIVEAAYTSPSGKRQTFGFETVSRETDLKTATFTFPEMNGAEVQSLGLGGRRFPLTCIFAGENCCKLADDFEELIKERGYGILEHPIYGKVNVVPTGTIKRTDDLVSKLNESDVEVTFAETLIDKTFPDSEVAAADKINDALAEYDDSAADDFGKLIKTNSVSDKIQLQSQINKQLSVLSKGALKIGALDPDNKFNLLQSIKNIVSQIKKFISTIDKIQSYANQIARTLIQLSRLPCRIAISALSKIEGYASIIKDVTNNVKSDPFAANAMCNQYAVTEAAWGGMIAALTSGVALTADNQKGTDGGTGAFTSRSDVLSAVTTLESMFDDYKNYCDKQISKNVFIDNSDSYEKLLNVVSYSLQALVETSFTLPTTRIITLGRDRQIIELLCELYGADGFTHMDEFINDNKLTADEIVCIPMGREIRYYV